MERDKRYPIRCISSIKTSSSKSCHTGSVLRNCDWRQAGGAAVAMAVVVVAVMVAAMAWPPCGYLGSDLGDNKRYLVVGYPLVHHRTAAYVLNISRQAGAYLAYHLPELVGDIGRFSNTHAFFSYACLRC